MSRVKRRRTENDEPFFDTQSAHSSRAGRSASDKGTKARMSIQRMIPLDLGQSSSLWIGLNPGLPSRGRAKRVILRMRIAMEGSLKDISLSPPSSSNVPPLAKSWLGASSGEAGRACSRGLEYRTTPRRFRNTTPLLMKVRRRRRHIRIWWGGAGRFRLRE